MYGKLVLKICFAITYLQASQPSAVSIDVDYLKNRLLDERSIATEFDAGFRYVNIILASDAAFIVLKIAGLNLTCHSPCIRVSHDYVVYVKIDSCGSHQQTPYISKVFADPPQ